MKILSLILTLSVLFAAQVDAQSLSVQHLVRSRSVISMSDLQVLDTLYANGLQRFDQVAGMEARVNLYPGRPILPGDVGPPAVVERNQTITLVFSRGALEITTEGRALARGAIGERIRVMNLDSKSTVSGIVVSSGKIRVTP